MPKTDEYFGTQYEGEDEMSPTESNELLKNEIVIVDDDVINLKLLSDMLAKEGYHVFPVISGELALQRIAFQLPSLILLDVMMPVMDGFEVCRSLKADERTCNIPVIFISGLDDEKSILEGFRAGGVDYICKPFRKEEVLARVKSQISLFRMQVDLKARNEKLENEIIRRTQAELALEKRMIALTQPLENSMVIDFNELFNVDDIQKLQDQFASAFGVASVITQTDGSPITKPSNFTNFCKNIIRCTEKGLINCMHSDTTIGGQSVDGPIVKHCMSGDLWDAGAGITVGGKHVANWLVGQIRNEVQDETKLKAYAMEIGADEEEYLNAFYEVPSMPLEQFHKISEMLFTMAGQLSDKSYQNAQQARFIHAKKVAEGALKESAEKFRSFFENSPIGITITSPDVILQVNKAFCEMLGYEEGELLNKNWREITHPEDISKANEVIISIMKGESQPARLEMRYLHKNKEFIWTDISTSLQWDTNQNSTYFITSLQDISVRKKAEDNLRKFKMGIDHSADAIFITEKNGTIEYINPAFEKIYGYKLSEVIGQSPRILYSDLKSSSNYEQTWNTLLAKGPGASEVQYRAKDGRLISVGTSNNPILDDRDEIIGYISIIREITDQKNAMETLLKFSKSIEQSPSTIVITDINGNLEYANPKFTEITGYTLDEVMGKNLRILKSGSIAPETYKNLWECISSGEVWRGEFLNRKKNGEFYWEWATMTSIKNEEGVISNYIAIKEDISTRKLMEADLNFAKEKAVENDRLKSAFLANMSHEIRTPLNSIIGFSEILSDPEFESDQRYEFAQIITNSGKELLAIISDIMDISKIEAGQVSVRKTVFSPQKLIQDIHNEFRIKTLTKGIDMRIIPAFAGEDLLIESDQTKIKQVLINFVGNALKFTDHGSIEIGLKVIGSSLEFYVRDTGIGIPEYYHTHVFERFRQVEDSLTRKYGGNGLGLTISKSLVEMLGGTIGMRSESGKGSLFYFILPDVLEYDTLT